MIGGAAAGALDTDFAKANLNTSRDGSGAAGGASAQAAVAAWSRESDSVHLKYTSRDGDVLEVAMEHSEESFAYAGVRVETGSAQGPRAGRDPAGVAAENAAAASPSDGSDDPKLKQLAQLREWASKVEEEVRKQQKRILEESLKRSGRFMPGCEGRFIVVYADPGDASAASDRDLCDSLVPEYWNAENTSDRIVHFATQMAEIAGEDSDFAKNIMQAVADGFDQAGAETGALPGAAGELNRKTRELTFSKLSKWLEERKGKEYNQGTRTDAISTAEVPYGIENHEQ
jgi:hypothetical protein